MNRRVTATLLAFAMAAGVIACNRGPAASKYSQRLVILGFDGMDPDLLKQWIDAGHLPTFKRLGRTRRALRARHDALAGITDVVGVLRNRRQRRQAQHLRLPGP